MSKFNNEQQLREDIYQIAQLMYTRGLICGPSGNISARLDENHIILSPGGLIKILMKPEDMIIVNMDGEQVYNTKDNQHRKPSSELAMHMEIYKNRPDVNGIVHPHPTNAVALTNMGIELDPKLMTEGMLFLGAVPTTYYGTPTTDELADSISEPIKTHDIVLLPIHGAIIAGHDVWQAFARAEVLEQVAEIQYKTLMLQQAGYKRVKLPKEKLEAMVELRKKFKHNLPSDHKLLKYD